MTDFLCLGSKITVDGDCSYEIRRQLLLGKKVMKNLDSMLKNKDITVPTKVQIVKAMVFPVVMYPRALCLPLPTHSGVFLCVEIAPRSLQ